MQISLVCAFCRLSQLVDFLKILARTTEILCPALLHIGGLRVYSINLVPDSCFIAHQDGVGGAGSQHQNFGRSLSLLFRCRHCFVIVFVSLYHISLSTLSRHLTCSFVRTLSFSDNLIIALLLYRGNWNSSKSFSFTIET